MGTKNNPGNFDCYSHAAPDEPMFILLGRDPLAGALVRLWARYRLNLGEMPSKVIEALHVADELDEWAQAQGKDPVRALWKDPTVKEVKTK